MRWARVALAIPAAALFVAAACATSAQAAPTPNLVFSFTPSYATYGASEYAGSQAVGTYSPGHLSFGPHFALASGWDNQSSTSTADHGHETQVFLVWSGLKGLAFSCSSACSATGLTVTVTWHLSWHLYMTEHCMPGTGYAEATLTLHANVTDVTTAMHSKAGGGRETVYNLEDTDGSLYDFSKVNHAYGSSFAVTLTPGHKYQIEAYVQAVTQAGGGNCGEKATIEIGGPIGESILNSITIG